MIAKKEPLKAATALVPEQKGQKSVKASSSNNDAGTSQ